MSTDDSRTESFFVFLFFAKQNFLLLDFHRKKRASQKNYRIFRQSSLCIKNREIRQFDISKKAVRVVSVVIEIKGGSEWMLLMKI